MTEEEWNTSGDVCTMLAFAAGRDAPAGAVLPCTSMTERKLRLFLVGCCRSKWELLTEPDTQHAVLVAERFADGEVSEEERARSAIMMDDRYQEKVIVMNDDEEVILAEVCNAARVTCQPYTDLTRQLRAYGRSPDYVPLQPADRHIRAGYCLNSLSKAVTLSTKGGSVQSSWARILEERAKYAELLRCICGNPFHPSSFKAEWLTSTVQLLVQGIYADRAFDRLPYLGDALEDAGCDDQQILSHCRGFGPHSRGCYVVDLVLGKA